MVVLDVNILVNGFRSDSEFHEECRNELELLGTGNEPFVLLDHVRVGFLRISTLRKLYKTPVFVESSLRFLEAIESAPPCYKAISPPRTKTFFDLVRELNAHGNDISDLYLASVAMDLGAELVTLDRGFQRIRRLRWRTPRSGTQARGPSH